MRVYIDTGTGWTEITAAVQLGSVQLEESLGEADGKYGADSLRFTLVAERDTSLARTILQDRTTVYAQLRAEDGTTEVWTGDVLSGRSIDVSQVGSTITGTLDLEAVDRIRRLSVPASSSFFGQSISMTSAATGLASRAGLSSSEYSWPSALNSITVRYVYIQKDEDVLSVLNPLLAEYGWTLITNASGTVTATPWWFTTAQSSAKTLTRSNLHSLRYFRKKSIHSLIKLYWHEAGTLSDQVVWELTDAQTLAASGDKFPADDTYQEYKTEWVAAAVHLSTLTEPEPISLVRVAGQTVEWNGTGLTLSTEEHESKRSKLQWTASAANAELKNALIKGTVTYRAFRHEITAPVEASGTTSQIKGGGTREVESRWLFDSVEAKTYIAALAEQESFGSIEITAKISSTGAPAIGAFVTITDTTLGLNQLFRIVRRTSYGDKNQPFVTLKLRGAATVSTTNVTETAISEPGKVAPVQQGIGIETWWRIGGSSLPTVPANTLGYQSPGTSGWSVAPASLTESNPTLWAVNRKTLGAPATGDAVNDRWSTPYVAGRLGPAGPAGAPGAPGDSGTRGPGVFTVSRGLTKTWSDAAANTAVGGASQRVVGDLVIQYASDNKWSELRRFQSGAWIQFTTSFLPGSLIVEGSITATALGAAIITAKNVVTGALQTQLRHLAVSYTTTDDAIYDFLAPGVVTGWRMQLAGVLIQTDTVVLPIAVRRTTGSKLQLDFAATGGLLAITGSAFSIEVENGSTKQSLREHAGEVASGSWIGW